jgi:hypothetical protein
VEPAHRLEMDTQELTVSHIKVEIQKMKAAVAAVVSTAAAAAAITQPAAVAQAM